MERRQQDSPIHGEQVHETFQLKIHGVVSLSSIARSELREKIFCAATQAAHVPWQFKLCDCMFDARGPTFRQRNHAIEGLLRKNAFERGAHGRKR